jgi:hypothetical protein
MSLSTIPIPKLTILYASESAILISLYTKLPVCWIGSPPSVTDSKALSSTAFFLCNFMLCQLQDQFSLRRFSSRSLEHSKNIIAPCWLRLNLGSLQMRHFWSVFAQIFGDLRNINPSEAKHTIKWSAGVVVITIPLHYCVDRNRSRVRSPR